jgi:hypothetical protein
VPVVLAPMQNYENTFLCLDIRYKVIEIGINCLYSLKPLNLWVLGVYVYGSVLSNIPEKHNGEKEFRYLITERSKSWR